MGGALARSAPLPSVNDGAREKAQDRAIAQAKYVLPEADMADAMTVEAGDAGGNPEVGGAPMFANKTIVEQPVLQVSVPTTASLPSSPSIVLGQVTVGAGGVITSSPTTTSRQTAQLLLSSFTPPAPAPTQSPGPPTGGPRGSSSRRVAPDAPCGGSRQRW